MQTLVHARVLIRHAESEGNVSNIAYSLIPDNQIPLSQRGMQQASPRARWLFLAPYAGPATATAAVHCR